jgi:hypothetical protein
MIGACGRRAVELGTIALCAICWGGLSGRPDRGGCFRKKLPTLRTSFGGGN